MNTVRTIATVAMRPREANNGNNYCVPIDGDDFIILYLCA